MGAEQSTPGEGPTAGAAEETKAEGIEKPKPPTAMSLDQKSTQAVLAGMEGVMARVPAEKISSGATIQDLALNLPTPGHERKRAGLPSMRSFLSWRPGSSDSSQHDGSTARSGSHGRLTDRFFLSKRGTEHNDPKLVFAGLCMCPLLPHAVLSTVAAAAPLRPLCGDRLAAPPFTASFIFRTFSL
jgi:hypothetical protein